MILLLVNCESKRFLYLCFGNAWTLSILTYSLRLEKELHLLFPLDDSAFALIVRFCNYPLSEPPYTLARSADIQSCIDPNSLPLVYIEGYEIDEFPIPAKFVGKCETCEHG